jgi:flagellin-specific chaperone FliS
MIVSNPIDLLEYRKQIERQQAVLQLSTFFDQEDKERIGQTLQELMDICTEKINNINIKGHLYTITQPCFLQLKSLWRWQRILKKSTAKL